MADERYVIRDEEDEGEASSAAAAPRSTAPLLSGLTTTSKMSAPKTPSVCQARYAAPVPAKSSTLRKRRALGSAAGTDRSRARAVSSTVKGAFHGGLKSWLFEAVETQLGWMLPWQGRMLPSGVGPKTSPLFLASSKGELAGVGAASAGGAGAKARSAARAVAAAAALAGWWWSAGGRTGGTGDGSECAMRPEDDAAAEDEEARIIILDDDRGEGVGVWGRSRGRTVVLSTLESDGARARVVD